MSTSDNTPTTPTPPTPAAHAAQATHARAKPRLEQLPPFRVLLHNDDDVEDLFVVKTLLELTPLDTTSAKTCMWSAHTKGIALVLVTHKERAELYQEQLISKGLTVTIEPENS